MDRLCKGKRLVHYVRCMDDIVLLALTRWELRRANALESLGQTHV